MSQLIPYIGMSGTWVLKSPLNVYIHPDAVYTCHAIRSFNELIEQQIDPLNTIYTAIGLTEQDYENGLLTNVVIISLVDGQGNWKYIPSDYIVSFPNSDGKLYIENEINITLDKLPIEVNLDGLRDEITSLIRTRLGIESETSINNSKPLQLVKYEDHDIVEAMRLSAISDNYNCNVQIAMLEEDNRFLKSLVDKITSCFIGSCKTGNGFTLPILPLFNWTTPGNNDIIDGLDLIVNRPVIPNNAIDLFIYNGLDGIIKYRVIDDYEFKLPSESGIMNGGALLPPGGVVDASNATDLFLYDLPLVNRTQSIDYSTSRSEPFVYDDTVDTRAIREMYSRDFVFWHMTHHSGIITNPGDLYVYKEYHYSFINQPLE